jgi:hypothetical protein
MYEEANPKETKRGSFACVEIFTNNATNSNNKNEVHGDSAPFLQRK